MNKRQQAIVDELTDLADESDTIEARTKAIQQRRIVLCARGRRLGLDNPTLADAARVEQVTIRSWVRKDRLARGDVGT